MKPTTSCLLFFLILIAVGVCITSFFNLNFYDHFGCSDRQGEITLKEHVSLSIPAGICNCTVSFKSNMPSVPSFSCECGESALAPLSLRGPVPSNTSIEEQLENSTHCPAPEIRIVEKEVIKEVVKKQDCHGGPWYAEGKTWHYAPRFPLCSMDACFNFSRCEDIEELLIYTYDLPAPALRYFSRLNESKYYTTDPEKACLFLGFLDTKSTSPTRPRELPYWNDGLNHVLVTFADSWEAKGPPQDTIGYASIMGTIVHETTNRAGFDIGIPLPGKVHMRHLQTLKPTERKYLATFRGMRYLKVKSDAGTFRSSDTFRDMHNGKDVIVVTSCRGNINNDIVRKQSPEHDTQCEEDQKVHKTYSYTDLMNTTFGLVPAGRQPASYRFIEVLSTGAIPVLIADNYVRPFETLIQWHKCLLQFPTSEMHRIVGTLRALKESEILKRQANCLQFYNEFLKDDETLMETSIRALKARLLGTIPSLTELRRRL